MPSATVKNINGGIKWVCGLLLFNHQKHYICTTKMTMATKLGRMVVYLNGIPSIKSHTTLIVWSCEIMWQTKTTIPPLPLAYGHQTWQGGNLSWKVLTHKVIWHFNDVVLHDVVTNWKHFTSSATIPIIFW